MRWLWVGVVLGLQAQPPKLVVGLVVDQMRADYLRRFHPRRTGGLGRLLREGLVYWNCHYPYFPTYTGPGHASIYTGTTPAYHGIVANDWWDRTRHQLLYCTQDSTVQPVGTHSDKARRSPRLLLATTIADEIRYACRFANKSIGIALKDRSAILPVGHSATVAGRLDPPAGQWLRRTSYCPQLPTWVERFNARRYPDSLLRLPWARTHHTACTDESPYEGTLPSESQPTFPHTPRSYADLLYTPAGLWLTFALAREAIEAERLGRGPCTDFLSLSFSTPDLAGHVFGPESCEIEELYAELDKELGAFLRYLERRFQRGEVLVFLTADHGAAPTPGVVSERGFPGGRYPEADPVPRAQAYLRSALGLPPEASPIAAFANQSFYFSPSFSLVERARAADLLKAWLLTQPHVIAAYTAQELAGVGGSAYPFTRVQAGFHPQRSGDVIVVYAPGWIEGSYRTGTTHGSIWTYDTHVPLLWWGGRLPSEGLYEPVRITQCAPTVAFLWQGPLPSAATDAPLLRVLERWPLSADQLLGFDVGP